MKRWSTAAPAGRAQHGNGPVRGPRGPSLRRLLSAWRLWLIEIDVRSQAVCDDPVPFIWR